MRRREFITLLAALATPWPVVAEAQQPHGIPRIGFLGPQRRLDKFREGMSELAHVEGRDYVIEHRLSSPPDRLPGFAAELVAMRVDVIVGSGSLAVRAAQQATRTIPIVMTGSSDPVGTGFVVSLGQPGTNITGLSLQSPELSAKRLQLLREVVTGLSRVAVLSNPEDPPVVFSLKETEEAARASGLQLQLVEARRPEDFEGAFASLDRTRPDALVVLPASLMTEYADRVAKLALAHRLPAISYFREFPGAGGLMSYGPNLNETARQAAVYVDKILKGAKPADLPVQRPTKFELLINLKTAKALGLTVPPLMLLFADDVIE
jgi:putative ABC transport system substrate-binding protein